MGKYNLSGEGGKGSQPRSVDKKKFDDNWDRIFGKKEGKKNEGKGDKQKV